MSKKKIHQKISMVAAFLLLTLYGFSASDLLEIKKEITRKKYNQALSLIDIGLEGSPDKVQEKWLRYYQGLSFLRLMDYDQAKRIFNGLMEKSLKGVIRDKVFLGLLDAHFLNEEYELALTVGTQLLRKNSDSNFLSLIYLKLGRTNMKLANWQDAHKYLQMVVIQFPDSLEYDLAVQFLEEQQYFAVQVGSFSNTESAQNLVDELNQKGEYAYLVESTGREKKKYYRVRVGKMSRLAEAKVLESKLSNAGYPTRIYP